MAKKLKKLKVDKNFTPCPVDDGDELYPNGIFEFNITKMLEYIHKNSKRVTPEEIEIKDFCGFSSITESHVDSVDISHPAIIVEISPGHYSLIDGHHRMEKAHRMGRESIFAYRLNVKQHMQFLTSKMAYVAYVEYWNDKLKR